MIGKEISRELNGKKTRLIVLREFLNQNTLQLNRHCMAGYYVAAQELSIIVANALSETIKLTEDIRQLSLDLERIQDEQTELRLSASAEPKRSNGNPAGAAYAAPAGAV